MKRLILISLSYVLLTSLLLASLFFISQNDYIGKLMVSEGITDPEKAWFWVANNIKPLREPAGSDVWQPAEITAILLTGDCEDYTILLGEFLYRLDYDSKMLISIKNRQPHAILEVLGVAIEPQEFRLCYIYVYALAEYTYTEYTRRAIESWKKYKINIEN